MLLGWDVAIDDTQRCAVRRLTKQNVHDLFVDKAVQLLGRLYESLFAAVCRCNVPGRHTALATYKTMIIACG